MSPRSLFVALKNRSMGPDSTPTVLSLLTVGVLLVIALLVPDSAFHGSASGAEVKRVAVQPAKPQRPISLRDRLVVGLQARTKSEVEFVERVDLRVRLGALPQRVVDETFFWARARAAVVRGGRTRRPIIYFQPAMAARAARLGVSL